MINYSGSYFKSHLPRWGKAEGGRVLIGRDKWKKVFCLLIAPIPSFPRDGKELSYKANGLRKHTLTLSIGVSLVLSGINPTIAGDLAAETYTSYVDPAGGIKLSEGFRQSWSHLGSWLVNDPKAPGYGLHDVYTQPAAVQAFLSTGQFPDGAVLIKEIRKIGSGSLTTGPAQWATDNAAWFVMVKDAKGRFKGNPNWGVGWGWALYEANNRNVNVSKGYSESCLACHMPAQKTDWVFLEGYPTLRKP